MIWGMVSWRHPPEEIDRHLMPGPENPPRDTHNCPHATEYGRTQTFGEHVVRCMRCGAPVDFAYPPPTKCSCQKAGAYDTECLLTGRCSEGKPA